MNREQYEAHKAFAGEKKPSMRRRRIGHDYQERRLYLITMTTEGRRPLLGRLTGNGEAPGDSADAARVEPTALGWRVREEWLAISRYHPEVKVVAVQVMPDHLHGILFVERPMKQHLGMIIRGFKASTNKHYRRLVLGQPVLSAATPSQQSQRDGKPIDDNRKPEYNDGRKPEPSDDNRKPEYNDGRKPEGNDRGDQKRDRRLDDREHGLLWEPGYNDHILSGDGELERWSNYLRDNPRRLAIRRAHPDFFRVQFGVTIGGQDYAAIGNRFLLAFPERRQVQLSRSLTGEQVAVEVEKHLALARQGVILVSPAISRGEQAVMRAVLDAGLPLIFLTPWGFNTFSKPGHQYYEACAAGRLLLLAPWPHQNERIALTRQMCLALNGMAREICGEERRAATPSQQSQRDKEQKAKDR